VGEYDDARGYLSFSRNVCRGVAGAEMKGDSAQTPMMDVVHGPATAWLFLYSPTTNSGRMVAGSNTQNAQDSGTASWKAF
jgi:hypothetical protein